MKHIHILKKALSLLLAVCMAASFAGCVPGGGAHAEPDAMKTTAPSESTNVPTDGTAVPADTTDAITMPTEETHISTAPTEVPSETFAEIEETIYAIANVNVRSAPGTEDSIIGSLGCGDSVQGTSIGSQGWSRVVYNGREAYVSCPWSTPPRIRPATPKPTATPPAPSRSPRNGTKTPGAISPTSSSPTTPGLALPAPTASNGRSVPRTFRRTGTPQSKNGIANRPRRFNTTIIKFKIQKPLGRFGGESGI